MKPVRMVEDIVLRKAAVKSGGTKATSGNIKNAARAVSESSVANTRFFIWFAAVFVESVFAMGIVIATIPRPSTSLVSDARTTSDTAANIPPETAMMQNIAAPPDSASASSAMISDALPEIKPGLLPVIPVPPFKTTSTAASNKKIVPKAVPPPRQPSKPKSVPPPTVITARSLLDATTFSVSERYDGPYKIAFVTDAGTYGKIAWDLGKAELTVNGSFPSFSITFSCDPFPTMPAPDALDQSPMFNAKTSYACAINLTPASGGDRQAQSKQISFTTGSGQLVVAPPSYANTLLKDDASFGGLVFRNDNAEPITVTGLDIDVSYKGLNVADSFLILRFADPATEQSLIDYHLENLAADPSVLYAHAGTNIHIPLSFTISAANQKMLPVNILGVRKLGIYGVDPTVTVTLRQVTTNQNLNRVVLDSAKISWSCIVPLGAYDPNATSGPYATGQACRQ